MSSNPVTYRLSYFNGKGLAEVSRLMFSAAEVGYDDHRFPFIETPDGKITIDEFRAEKADLPMQQVPV
jgi:hypothetical protein